MERMSKAFDDLKKKIESKKFRTYSESRWEINRKSVSGDISKKEYTELRVLLNRVYYD